MFIEVFIVGQSEFRLGGEKCICSPVKRDRYDSEYIQIVFAVNMSLCVMKCASPTLTFMSDPHPKKERLLPK